jgi:hypothetical protein
MASYTTVCVCELSIRRPSASVIRCPCGLFLLPTWAEFVHPPTIATNQLAFMPPRVPQPFIFPELPCQPILIIDPASGENVVIDFEINLGPNSHPFWTVVQSAFEASAADWRFQLQQISAEASSGPTPSQYRQRLQRLRFNCLCLPCSCVNYST